MPSFIPNPANVPLDALLPRLQDRYPNAEIKKPFLSPRIINVPVDNFKMIVRAQPKRNRLWIDFIPPVLWTILGMAGTAFIVSLVLSLIFGQMIIGVGALVVILGFVITKAIFKSRNRARFANFEDEVQRALQPRDGSIF